VLKVIHKVASIMDGKMIIKTAN